MDTQRIAWRVSTRSTSGAGANCVEVGATCKRIALRDSKDRSGPALVSDHGDWLAFLDAVKNGSFGS